MNVVQIPGSGPVVQPQLRIKARGLASRKMTIIEKALLLRDIAIGKVQLMDLSVRQLAAIIDISLTYAYAAVRLDPDDCEDLRRGLRPLILPREPKQPTTPAMPLSPRERFDEIVAEVGQDAALAWLVASEQRSAAAA